MHKFTHVESLQQVYNYIKLVGHDMGIDWDGKQFPRSGVSGGGGMITNACVSYRGTVKLHGSNAGVCCSKTGLTPQSRNRELSLQSDNMGFATFVAQSVVTTAIRDIEKNIRCKLCSLAYDVKDDDDIVLFGEWIGPGIQNGVAINRLPNKMWVVFAVMIITNTGEHYVDVLTSFDGRYDNANVYSILDVQSFNIDICWDQEHSIREAAENAQKMTLAVEDTCPWGVKFGLQGTGEGIVWSPIGRMIGYPELFWKTKGPKHTEVARLSKNRSILDPDVVSGIDQFVTYAVTEARLEKGIDYLNEMGYLIDVRSMGYFLKWIGNDVERECAQVLIDSGLSWNQVSKSINSRAKDFLIQKAKSI